MDKLFLTILNMSMTGAFVIAAICLVRLPLKKAPKIISYCLWAMAGFRLVFPYSVESVFSLIPFKAQTIPSDIAMQSIPRIDSGIPFVNNAVSSVLPAATPAASVNPLQIWIAIGAWVWIVGVAVLLIYGVVSFLILKRKMSEVAHIKANIYEAENIKSPFVLGVFRPRIYFPVGLSEQEKSYITLHEQTHIRRHDHIVKFAAYFVLCLHWFNPFAWVAFLLMGVDMEMSCDERVLKEMGVATKKAYSLSLLSLATDRRIIGGSPLAFGEGGIRVRIKNVISYKKPAFWVIIIAILACVIVAICFMTNPVDEQDLSFLNYDNLVSVAAQSDTLPAHVSTISDAWNASVDGGELSVFLDNVTWVQDRGIFRTVQRDTEKNSTASIQITFNDNAILRIFDTDTVYIYSKNLGKFKYYRAELGDYSKLLQMLSDIGNPSSSKPALSALSEQECLEFLSKNGIEIPIDFQDNLELGKHVKKIISEVEADPHKVYVVSYTVAYDFFQEIKEAVNNYYGVTNDTVPPPKTNLNFWVKPDEPPQVIGETAAAIWLKSFIGDSVPASDRISDFTVKMVTVISGTPKAGQEWHDMPYQYVVQVEYSITTATTEYHSPEDGIAGAGTFEGIFRELCVKSLANGSFEIVSVGTGGVEQELISGE